MLYDNAYRHISTVFEALRGLLKPDAHHRNAAARLVETGAVESVSWAFFGMLGYCTGTVAYAPTKIGMRNNQALAQKWE